MALRAAAHDRQAGWLPPAEAKEALARPKPGPSGDAHAAGDADEPAASAVLVVPALDREAFRRSRAGKRRVGPVTALVAAVGLHGGVLAAVMLPGLEHFSGRGTTLDSISVEVVVVSRAAGAAVETGSLGPVGPAASSPRPDPQEDAPTAEPDGIREAVPRTTRAAVPRTTDDEEAAEESGLDTLADARPTESTDPDPVRDPEAGAPRGTPDRQPAPKERPLEAGGGGAPGVASAPGPEESQLSAARSAIDIAASDDTPAVPAAVVRAFNREVVAVLTRHKPRLDRRRRADATAKVAFTVAQDGAPRAVRLLQSSGRDDLDAAALAAVSRVRFPAPPAGMSVRQRSYVVPYLF